jgi:hypothetical protein
MQKHPFKIVYVCIHVHICKDLCECASASYTFVVRKWQSCICHAKVNKWQLHLPSTVAALQPTVVLHG